MVENENYKNILECKIITLGEVGVGKTSIITLLNKIDI